MMFRTSIVTMLLLLAACNGTTDPYGPDYSMICLIDTDSMAVTDEIAVESGSYSMCCSPSGSYLYASQLISDHVIRINLISLEITGAINFGEFYFCSGIAVNDQGDRLYAVVEEDLHILHAPSLTRLDSLINETPGLFWISCRPGTDLVYGEYTSLGPVPGQGLYVIDGSAGSLVNTFHFDQPISVPVFSSDGSSMYVMSGTSVLRLDPDTGVQTSSFDTGESVTGLCFLPDRGSVCASWADFSQERGGLLELDGSTLALRDSMACGRRLVSPCFVPVRNEIYADAGEYGNQDLILAVDLERMEILGTVNVPVGLYSLEPDPGGEFVYCSVEYGVDL